MDESLVKYHDSCDKLEKRVIEFYALLLACSDYGVELDNYSDIDDLMEADDYESTINQYKKLAEELTTFNRLDISINNLSYGDILDLELANNIIKDQIKIIKDLGKENRLLKISYAKCRDCKHANLYIPNFAFPHLEPQCELGVKKIHSDSSACEDFALIGRCSR